MKISGSFKTQDNNTIRVVFYNKKNTASSININTSDDIYFSEEPVIITTEVDDTFAHLLKTQAKITLVTRKWLGDYLFADNVKSIVVNIWKNDVCIFAGYVSANTYNQQYSHELEEIEINCVDTLSTLKNRRLTDDTKYEDLVAQSTIRPFSWFFDKIDLEDPAGVIPNLPDYPMEEMYASDWIETSWGRNVNDTPVTYPDGQDTVTSYITYYGIESECVILDEETAVATGETRIGEDKTPIYIQSTDTCIVDGIQYYKKYAWITVNGELVNTGDWIVGDPTGDMPYVVRQETRLTGWTNGVLPQPFDFWEHFTTFDVYSNGMEIAVSDGIGEQIPETPQTTTNGSYYEFRQGSEDDLDIDEITGTEYYKNYAWVCVNNVCENSGQWVRGNEYAYVVDTRVEVTGWQYDDPAVAFEYYETVSHWNVYNNGNEVFTGTTMGSQIPLFPQTTSSSSYYEFRQAGSNDLDVDTTTGLIYFKEYAWVIVNGTAEKTNNWRRGNEYNQFYDDYLTIEAITSGTVKLLKYDNEYTNITSMSYSKDKTNWSDCFPVGGEPTIQMNVGDKVYFKGSGVLNGALRFKITCESNVYGNIMSLMYEDNFSGAYTVGINEFNGLFSNLDENKIISAQNLILPATTLAESCYSYMFSRCTSLTTAPALPATTLAEQCYLHMFNRCTSLTSAPALPATIVADSCYEFMFQRCTSLTSAPALPAIILAGTCYGYMFDGCTSLTSAPALPATTLAGQCYMSMFGGCTSLTSAPALPATTLAESCYYGMFQNCTSLTTVPALPATTLSYDCYDRMFYGCTSLTSAPALPATTLAENCYLHMFNGCTSLTSAPALPATTLANYCYGFMFQNCTSLTTAPALPATTLADDCYSLMFGGCTSLTSAPALPATTLAESCYDDMFYGCTSLTTVPALPATTLAESCYAGMFSGCTSLTSAPALPATTLAYNCYEGMFYNCSSLVTAPSLPATTLTYDCYDSMFSGCTSLTSAPALPAITLAERCYISMFSGCTSLVTAPALHATILTERCYMRMFYNCSNISSVTMLATDISATNCLELWLYGVSTSGTFTKAESMTTLPTGSNGIPSGWTVRNAPKIYGTAISTQTTAPTITLNGTTYTADVWDDTTKEFGFTNVPTNITSISITDLYDELIFSNYIDTSNMTSMRRMTYNGGTGCQNLQTLDISSFDVSSVTNMDEAFYRCNVLSSLILPDDFDTSNVTTMKNMFYACRGLDLNSIVSTLDGTSVTNLNSTFMYNTQLTSLDLSTFNSTMTQQVTTILQIFMGCSNITSINLSNLNASSSINVNSAFSNCSRLQSLTVNNISNDLFNKIIDASTSKLRTATTIYRDGDTYVYDSNTNTWIIQ